MSGALVQSNDGLAATQPRKRSEWCDERVAVLRDFFDLGMSHELIAQALGTTKGAISAKLDRLMDADPATWRRSATVISLKPDRSAIAAKADQRRADAAMRNALEQSTVGVTLLDLEARMCRWPLGMSVGEQTFCGAQAGAGSYCQSHAARSRVRPAVSTGATR